MKEQRGRRVTTEAVMQRVLDHVGEGFDASTSVRATADRLGVSAMTVSNIRRGIRVSPGIAARVLAAGRSDELTGGRWVLRQGIRRWEATR